MVENEVLKLKEMSVLELKTLWREYFDSEPLWKTKRFYIPRLAYRMQELAYGGVAENIKNLLLQTKDTEKPKIIAKPDNKGLPKAGTHLVKTYHGKEYNVLISETGFHFEGKYYKSLSSIAMKITGQHISGRFFFGFGDKKK